MKHFLIPIAALLLVPSWLRADEIPSGYTLSEDGTKIVKAGPVIPPPRTRIMRAAWLSECGKNIYPRECARIKRKDAERERERRRDRVYAADQRDDYDRGRRCSGRVISAKGAQRPTEGWARRVAIEAWAREVRYDLGETYLTWSNARNARIICNPSSIGGFQIRCEARGEPCQIR